MGKIILLILLIILIYCFCGGIFIIFATKDEKLHKFKFYSDGWETYIKLNDQNDKFAYFSIFIFWPFILIFYYIPKALYCIGSFLINYIAWCIAKLFKL